MLRLRASGASDEILEEPIELLAAEPSLGPIDDLDGGRERDAIGLQLPEESLAAPSLEVRESVAALRAQDAGDPLLGTRGFGS